MGRRSCNILFRKVIGAKWPPELIIHHMAAVSLVSIFDEAGVTLNCRWLDDEIPHLEGGRSFEPADLRACLRSAVSIQSSDDQSDWTAYVLIVPEIITVANGRFSRPLGLMFDVTASESGMPPRQGCAIAWRRVQDDGRTYLRTVAHELGHVFNLRHPGDSGEPYPQDAVNTLMVPNQYLRPTERYPETIEFRFSLADRAWLSQAPEHYVRPGGADYGARPPDWSPP